MIDGKKIDALKKKIASVRLGSTKKHYKVSIGEICNVLLVLVEQLEQMEVSTTTFVPQEILDEPETEVVVEVNLPIPNTTTMPPNIVHDSSEDN